MPDAMTRRVQRVPNDWPLVHLEEEPAEVTSLRIDGQVRHSRTLPLAALPAFGVVTEEVAVHCVWGWSRPQTRWTGVRVADVLDTAGTEGGWAVVSSASGTYSSCLPVEDAARGLLVWERDGEPLASESGGPLRFVAPPTYWAYKHVKWACRITVVDSFSPGFWEAKVADPLGRIPEEVELP